MKLFETSILELLAQPLKIFPIIRQSWITGAREAYIYEHIYTGFFIVLVASIADAYGLVILTTGFTLHVVVKEFIHDGYRHGYIDWANVIERLYGFVLGFLFLYLQG